MEHEVWKKHSGGNVFSPVSSDINTFYPSFQYEDYSSYSIYRILRKKGFLDFNDTYIQRKKGRDVNPPDQTIDAKVKRNISHIIFKNQETNIDRFIVNFIMALQKDVREIEDANPLHKNFILCGGKDSLNLLLLDWKNPVTVLSAAPNYQLVKQFIIDNHLDFETIELFEEENHNLLERELLECSYQVDLCHWKWTSHLKRISEKTRNVIFWKGQVLDLYATNYWRSYTSSQSRIYKIMRKIYKNNSIFNGVLDKVLENHILNDLSKSIYNRASVLQGSHMGFLRSICNCLTVSAYHGNRVQDVLSSANFSALTKRDFRPLIGQHLHGKDVIYPKTNPSPEPSYFKNISLSKKQYLELYEKWRNLEI